MYFQHDRAPPHYTQDVREDLHKNFSSCLLGCGGPLAQPPRSPDLTTLDFYLWGHMMALVYERKVDSRTVLRHCILCNSSVHIYKTIQTAMHQLPDFHQCMLNNAYQLEQDTLNNHCKAGTLVLPSRLPKYAVDYIK
jgi:hypothetical protein